MENFLILNIAIDLSMQIFWEWNLWIPQASKQLEVVRWFHTNNDSMYVFTTPKVYLLTRGPLCFSRTCDLLKILVTSRYVIDFVDKTCSIHQKVTQLTQVIWVIHIQLCSYVATYRIEPSYIPIHGWYHCYYSMLQNKVNVLYCYYSAITIVNIAYYNIITEVL